MKFFRTATATADQSNGTRRRRSLPIALRLVIGLLLLVVVGTLLLMLPGVGTERMLRPNEALFTAASALSVTGLSVITPARDLTRLGQVVLLLLIQVGGVGFMVVAVAAIRLLGQQISLMDRLALRDSFGLIDSAQILLLTKRVVIGVLVIEGIGALALWLHWRSSLGNGPAVFYAIFHAVSAFCNAGFDLFGGAPQHPNGLPTDGITLSILGALIILGGLGIPVLADMLTWFQDRTLSLHTRITLATVGLLLVIGAVGIWLVERSNASTLAELPWYRQMVLSTFQSVSVRTAGFAAVSSFDGLQPATQLLMIALMFVGCAPASMGGGITTGTLAVLVLALWGYARGLPTAQVGGRKLAVGTVRRAAAVLTVSLFVVVIATWLILATHTTATLDAALFEVVSAFATCGLTLAFTSQLNLFGQIVIVLVMMWGRLGALTIILALAQQRPSQRVTYPEASVLIG